VAQLDKILLGHTAPNGCKEALDAHSNAVAGTARKFSEKFGAGDMGGAAGLLHDLGKAKPEFQDYLLGKRGSEPHSAEGAKFAAEHYAMRCPRPFEAPIGRLLAFAIAGHHSGLANGRAVGGGTSPLNDRLKAAEQIEPWFARTDLPVLRGAPVPLMAAKHDPFGWQFFARMLFSALVDADSLETERWFAEANNEPVERGWSGALETLKTSLDRRLSEFDSDASELARLRAEVLLDCRAAANEPTGLFSLTVPTGGGKTLSSLAFALDHAIKHELDRIIYVIPFTSIVEQTAGEFRKALSDDDAILEHHSAFDEGAVRADKDLVEKDGTEKIRLARQNWDRPIVVTTAVQFFESLFANRRSPCRKLHNIARSVVVLDEAQTLPLKLLRPCLAALNELARGYRTSVVLCTATQPALTKDAGLKAPEALVAVREIIKPGRNLYGRLQRVRTRANASAPTRTPTVRAWRCARPWSIATFE
jgi:CRISPR-associated endonuclease/helicase Cas3